ncbi:ABC transporter permease subunit [Cryptosporangium aurantiacum]|uniref:Branched-chain amino acid transport system permease protein n=1 Tax=Cryptosporangium aurantiacum TaxID=134849 RepID=A0A1M7KFI7_9ACTN|nr:ABC transporter permease [Cryptosporangium aurantiacum]SHM64075.1 branched-chain amino acid transport system permease protein [Cryptosporangium aurantiacum]
MLSYVLAGLALGSIYAIAAGSLVVTYVASGIFSLAFAAMAFTVARVYYALNTEAGWPILPSAVVALLVFAPIFGAALYWLLFRHLRQRSMLVKLMATMGLSVALPPLVELIMGHLTSVTAPGLAPRPLATWHPFGAVLNADQLVAYLGLAVVLLIGVGVLRFTDVGLKVRALVDSEALTGLSGTSPGQVSLGVWAASATLAGLAGILIAPTAGLSAEGMTVLMSAAFAAVVAARLRSLPIAVSVALLMGLVTTVIQKYLDPESPFTAAVVPSVPFAFMLVFLLYYAARGQAGDTTAGGALDRAISVQDETPAAPVTAGKSRLSRFGPGLIPTVVFVAIVAALPLTLSEYWAGLAAAGIALAIALLSYTLVTGEGGMVWLCQITFAGLGAVLSAELTTYQGWPPLLAVVAAAIVVVPLGVILGVLTIRLGNLYVALVTLAFGLLVQTLVFTRDRFYNFGSGQPMPRPSWAVDNQTFALLTLGAFLLLGLVVLNLRRSTAGLAMSAVRWSENGSRTLGISVVQAKVLVSGVASFVAAVGGGFLAMNFQSSLPDSFAPFLGLVWLAVLVTLGSRSIMAALAAGLLFYLMPGLFSTYLPSDLAGVPVILFGLGAIALANHPEGAVAQNGAAIARLVARFRTGRTPVMAYAKAEERA